MGIILSRTYETWTPDDVDAGDTDSRGFDWEDVPHTFRETVELLEHHANPSCRPGVPRWTSSDDDVDYRTGERTIYSLHPADDARSQRYWVKACRAAGIVERGE